MAESYVYSTKQLVPIKNDISTAEYIAYLKLTMHTRSLLVLSM